MSWIRACAAGELDDGEALRVEAAIPVALFRVDGEFFATQDICSHGQSSLAEGYLDGDQVECLFHMATFCVKSGKATKLPANVDLRTFETKVESDDVFVFVEDGATAY